MLSLSSSSISHQSKRALLPQNNQRKVHVSANAKSTAWGSWDKYMVDRKPVAQPSAEENKLFVSIGSSISSSVAGFKPKHTASSSSASASETKQVHVAKVAVVPLSADLHEKLEAQAITMLKSVIGLNDSQYLDASSTSTTTTDINAGICIAGCVAETESGDKVAHIAFVATETERQASWSRLEGLLLHWACVPSRGGGWTMPPPGWTSTPPKSYDAGGAVQSPFVKEKGSGGNMSLYSVTLTLPLSGVLRSGGLAFVLKASDAQNTKWLKDASSDKDFYVDISSLPLIKK